MPNHQLFEATEECFGVFIELHDAREHLDEIVGQYLRNICVCV
jgi:hypothetical protein